MGAGPRTENSNIEIRNSKQFQMTKNTNFQTNLIRIRRFGLSEFEIYLAVRLFLISCFGFRIYELGRN